MIESKESQHILLISYTFPPYPGIGGRRWAKFAKYLSKLGYTVHVIHAPNPFPEKSLWTDEIENDERIKRYEVKSHYPAVLLTNPKTLFQKISYRVSLMAVKLLTKGTPYDKGVFWKEPMLDKSITIIKEFNIKNVIVSCAPFSSGYYSVELKERCKDLNLIIDFRDPWTWAGLYGFSQLSKKRIEFEKNQENLVMEFADNIFVPVDVMKTHLDLNYKTYAHKVSILPHAFDKDEIESKLESKDSIIKIIFYGTLYDGLENYFKRIAIEIEKLGRKVLLEIYSDSERYSNYFAEIGVLNKRVFYYKSLPTKELFLRIRTCSFILLIHPDHGVNNLSTKFYEIIYSRTPILYISKPGTTSDFIKNNALGYFFELKDIETNFGNVVNGNVPYPYNQNYKIDEYAFDELTKTLILNYFKE